MAATALPRWGACWSKRPAWVHLCNQTCLSTVYLHAFLQLILHGPCPAEGDLPFPDGECVGANGLLGYIIAVKLLSLSDVYLHALLQLLLHSLCCCATPSARHIDIIESHLAFISVVQTTAHT